MAGRVHRSGEFAFTEEQIRYILRNWPIPQWRGETKEDRRRREQSQHVFPGTLLNFPNQENLYKILGSHKNASADELKKTYRDLVMRWHPDRNPGDKKAEEKFKKITHAYAVLSDPQKRQIYDQTGVVPQG